MKRFKHSLFLGAISLILSIAMCSCHKTDTCNRIVSVVNNSDTTIRVSRISYIFRNGQNYCYLTGNSIEPHSSFPVSMVARECLEEILPYCDTPDGEPSSNFTFYVIPNNSVLIETASVDSIEIVYDILKKINLAEIGVDSLIKTDFTIYYP